MVKSELPLRIVLVDPPAGVVYGIQRGRGSKYSVDFAQLCKRGDVVFDLSIVVADAATAPNFLGEYVQGPRGRRFLYVDVGQYALQRDSEWARRMIVRLDGVTRPLIQKAITSGGRLEARIEGTGKDGGPNCATVQPIAGWRVV